MFYTDDDIQRIGDATADKLVDVASQFITLSKSRSGDSYTGECPHCHSKKFSISENKHIFKCWSCQEVSGNSTTAFLMKAEGMSFVEALDYLVNRYSIFLPDREESKPAKQKKTSVTKEKKKSGAKEQNSFCYKMLETSGLTYDDVRASIYKTNDKKSIFECRTFHPGTINDKGEIIPGDDVIIEYYDLDGFPVMYEKKDQKKRLTGIKKEYFRVRWQYPDAHLDKNGESFKYKSPSGSGTPLYIPQRVRELYKKKEKIERLFIQEGEKKAEKASKHGIPSVAVSGIQNIGLNGSLPEDLVSIIQQCEVKEVIFLFDSDWDDLSANLRINVPVDKRPRNFFYAARNFKQYMRSLKNRDIYVEIYIGHINKNDAGDKGLDDLLVNSLSGRELDLKKDIDILINEKNLAGEFVQLFKITTLTDHNLEELWALNSPAIFAERHKDVLKNMPEFMIGRYRWKFDENGQFVLAQPFDTDEQFWMEVEKRDRSQNERIEYQFCYVNSQNFLQNRGFGRYRRQDKSYFFIHVDNPVVSKIEANDARDYLFTFAKHYCRKEVNEMLIKGVSQYVGPDKLSLLNFITPNFLKASRDEQYFYFDKGCWQIRQNEIKEIGYESITHNIWDEQKKDFPAKYLKHPLITFTRDTDGVYHYNQQPEAKECHFLQFLVNTSNFTWRKKTEEIEEVELQENRQHLLSKLCAIGYMLIECKDPGNARAVIGMDGKQSEVGDSNGRSGKSLIGEALRVVLPTAYIPGKRRDLLDDNFLWNDVVENTKIVFFDDVLINFNFEFLFPNITGDWTVNYKGGRRITYPFNSSPKIYIATNHAIKGSGSSFKDRQWLLAFSDFYNSDHKPVDDFGSLFFSEWDYNQWNSFWNLMANCVQLYLKFGVVQAPGERLEQRKLRQEITEGFISWADEYFSDPEHRNVKIPRKQLQDAYLDYDPLQRRFFSPTEFKKRFIKYCEWAGYVFNPQMYDPVTHKPYKFDKDGKPVVDDKSGGVEFFTLGCDNTRKSDYFDNDKKLAY